MSLNKRSHVIAFAAVLGVLAYLTGALHSAKYIIVMPMAKDAVTDWVEIERENSDGRVVTDSYPTEFKNTLEELKYGHNIRMLERNRRWVYGTMVVGGLLGWFAFYCIPKWRKSHEIQRGTAIGGAILGALAVVLIPLILSWLLPAPANWFPEEITASAKKREREALLRLKALAREIDADREERP